MMVSSRSTVSLCSRHTQFKKFLFYLCVVAWLALFFMSGKLFLQRREESSRLQVSKFTYFCVLSAQLIRLVILAVAFHTLIDTSSEITGDKTAFCYFL